jgi:hypothetical protein
MFVAFPLGVAASLSVLRKQTPQTT